MENPLNLDDLLHKAETAHRGLRDLEMERLALVAGLMAAREQLRQTLRYIPFNAREDTATSIRTIKLIDHLLEDAQ